MNNDFKDAYGQIRPEHLDEFETRAALALPQSYREFLLIANGGKPSNSWFVVPGWPGKRSCVDKLFGIHEGQHNNLLTWKEELEDRLIGFIAIGVDEGGNYLCIKLDEPGAGAIFFWDSSPDWSDSSHGQTMYRIASSIQDFLSGLTQNPIL